MEGITLSPPGKIYVKIHQYVNIHSSIPLSRFKSTEQ